MNIGNSDKPKHPSLITQKGTTEDKQRINSAVCSKNIDLVTPRDKGPNNIGAPSIECSRRDENKINSRISHDASIKTSQETHSSITTHEYTHDTQGHADESHGHLQETSDKGSEERGVARKSQSAPPETHHEEPTKENEHLDRSVKKALVRRSAKPEVHFCDLMGERGVLLDRFKETEAVIESLRDNVIHDKARSSYCSSEDTLRLIPVDWLGVPLASSTVPDFKSTTKLDFTYPPRGRPNAASSRLNKISPCQEDVSYRQFSTTGRISEDIPPPEIPNGYLTKEGQISQILPHPITSVWNVPSCVVERVRKQDPMEYLNLLDPSNTIPVKKGIYQYLIRDQCDVGPGISIGKSVRSSGFLNNRLSYLPIREERDFKSIYKKSFSNAPELTSIEGLAEMRQKPFISYPNYEGAAGLEDIPSAFQAFGPNVLKKNPLCLDPSFEKNFHRRKMASTPPPRNMNWRMP